MVAMPIVWDERAAARAGRRGLRRPRDAGTEVPPARMRCSRRSATPFRRSRTTTRSCARSTIRSSSPTSSRRGSHGTPPGSRTIPASAASSRSLRPRGIRAREVPAAQWARPGYFAYDTMTLIGPGLGGRAGSRRCRADRRRSRHGRRAARVRAVPPAGTSRLPRRLRRLVLPQQRRGRGRGAAPLHGPGRRPRRRRAPRQRDAGDLLGPGRRPRRVGPRRSGGRLVPAFPRLRGRVDGVEPQPAAPPGTGDDGWLAAVREATEWLEPRRSSSPSESTRARAIPRARCGDGVRIPRGRAHRRCARPADGARPGGRLRPRNARTARAGFLSGVESAG